MRNRKSALIVRALPLMIAAAYAGSAFADEVKLEEIIVTAQKRVERLQDVPISISAIGGAQLETRGIEGAANLNGLVPNVTIKAAAPGGGLIAAVSIRGLNQGQPAIWADPAVGMYMDGVFVGKNQGSLFDMADLERVEVLRGPQGTLFGRNTEGGAINFITRKPSGQFSGNVGLELGNRGRHVERVSIDLPKVGAMSLSFALRNEIQDGWVDNPNGKAWGSKDRQGARLAANFDISPKFKVDYAYDRSDIDETPTAVSLLSATGYNALYTRLNGAGTTDSFFGMILRPQLQARASSEYPTSVASNAGTKYFQKLDVDGHMLTATYELNPQNTLKYIGAYRKMHYQDSTDLDGTPIHVFNAGKDTNYSTYSHEFQLIGSAEKLNYVLGYYQFKDDGNTFTRQSGLFYNFGFDPRGAYYQSPYYRVTTDAKAVFAQADYKVTDALTATVGYRRTVEEKGGEIWRVYNTSSFGMPGPNTPVATSAGAAYGSIQYIPGFTPQSNTASFSATTPVLALAYRLNENVNVFGRMAKGFRSGGFSLEAASAAAAMKPFNPERSTAYELGVKTNFWNGKGQMNATVFHTDITNFHVSKLPVGGTTPVIENAGKVKLQGLEVEGVFALAPGWKLQAGYGFLETKVLEAEQFNQFGALINAAGNSVTGYGPRHQINLALDGRLAKTAFGTLRGIVDYTYSAKYYNYSGQRTSQGWEVAVGNSTEESLMPALTTVNARLLLAGIPVGGSGEAEASLWVRNLTDRQQMNGHIDVGGFYRIAGWTEPRTYGVSFGYKW
ncbi:TonB-dependent receptor [Denitratisoma oestradiolicum]|uniref:Putative TonB-dependent receptor n=1 Tax=Denitratisoma oestradiolicum TaxID=311182 RepID=A0A6S6XZZ4_9PROT|nr:TonB-dependent receptor [Denitratisoma oestradiolicum]TWO81621.1 hypothetical protein CBW56_02605 [Denitratisoma oestradiolicum]CAB1370563.1 putative TonB-dependent receptor [Denitratisoma oestradiolicum]